MENNNKLSLESKIEALLFYKGEPVSFKSLEKAFEASKEDVAQAIEDLGNTLLNRGITLVKNSDEVMLGTSTELSSFFEDMRKEELTKDLTKASLETLSIILYKENVSRAEIDYIRGVNSSFILRNLQIRGLVDRKTDPNDNRAYVYTPSLELLSFMGVSGVRELPDYEEVSSKLKNKIESHEDGESNTTQN